MNDGALLRLIRAAKSDPACEDVVSRLVEVSRGYGKTEATLAFWLCSPSGYFDGGCPADHLADADRVVAAANGHYGIQW